MGKNLWAEYQRRGNCTERKLQINNEVPSTLGMCAGETVQGCLLVTKQSPGAHRQLEGVHNPTNQSGDVL